MKTLRFLGMMFMAAMMSFSFTACGDDNNSDGNNAGGAGTYLGQWITEFRNTGDNRKIGIVELTANSWQMVQYSARYNNNVLESVSRHRDSGSLQVDGNQVTATGNNVPFRNASFTINGNTMTLNYQGGTMTMTRPTQEQLSLIAAWDVAYNLQPN